MKSFVGGMHNCFPIMFLREAIREVRCRWYAQLFPNRGLPPDARYLIHPRMHVVNCHQNTEAADLLGGLRPLRGRDILVQDLRDRAGAFVGRCIDAAGGGVREEHVKVDTSAMGVPELTATVQVREAQSPPLLEQKVHEMSRVRDVFFYAGRFIPMRQGG